MLKHLWLPMLILGVGGTAGLIRIMRANLLDELRRPYVTTGARQGPDRGRLHPQVPGAGGHQPLYQHHRLVAAAPDLGRDDHRHRAQPAHHRAAALAQLIAQDMYLAGHLHPDAERADIIGTLISDILLAWLDPRIRYE